MSDTVLCEQCWASSRSSNENYARIVSDGNVIMYTHSVLFDTSGEDDEWISGSEKFSSDGFLKCLEELLVSGNAELRENGNSIKLALRGEKLSVQCAGWGSLFDSASELFAHFGIVIRPYVG